MTLATPYAIGTSRSYPMMQLDFKENVQNMSKGAIYVKLAPAGQLGVGSVLVQKVQTGTIQEAQHSIPNCAPFAPVVDVTELPYWCAENQQLVNLVTSAAWQKTANHTVAPKGP